MIVLPKSYVGIEKLVTVVPSRNSNAQTAIFPESTRDKPLKNGRSIPFVKKLFLLSGGRPCRRGECEDF